MKTIYYLIATLGVLILRAALLRPGLTPARRAEIEETIRLYDEKKKVSKL